MRKIFLGLALLLLAGCAVQPVTMSGQAESAAPGFSTLADANDPIEMAAAPVITKAAMIRYSATKRLKAGSLDKAGAWSIQNCVDHVINTVNRGVLEKRMSDVETGQQLIKGCEQL